MDLLNLPRILEASFGLLNAATATVVLLLARRIAPTLTLSMHQRAMRILVAIAILIVLSELVGVFGPFFRPSTFADVAEEFAELLAISSGCFALLYLMSRAEREEVSSLGRSANVDELTDLSSRTFFRRAAARRIELSQSNNLPLACAVIDVDDFKPYTTATATRPGTRPCAARHVCCASRHAPTTWPPDSGAKSSSC